MHWMCASLRGYADEFHSVQSFASGNDESSKPLKCAILQGNTRKPSWLNTMYEHSERMMNFHQNKAKKMSSNFSIIEACNYLILTSP